MPRRHRATLLGCLAIICWSTSSAADILLVNRIGALPAMGLVTGMAALILGQIEMARGHRLAALVRMPPLLAIVGGGGFVGYQMLFYSSFGRSTGPLMSIQLNLVNYLWPTLVVLACAARDRARIAIRPGLLAIGLACAGAGMCCSLVDGLSAAAFTRLFDLTAVRTAPGAFLFMLCAAVCWTVYCLVAQRTADTNRPSSLPAFFAMTAIASLVASGPDLGRISWSPGLCALLVGTAVIPTAAGYLLWEVGIAHGEPRLLGALSNALPLLSTVVAAAAIGLPLHAHLLVAAGLIALGTVLTLRAASATTADRRP